MMLIAIDTQPFEHQYALRFGRWLNDSKSFTFELTNADIRSIS